MAPRKKPAIIGNNMKMTSFMLPSRSSESVQVSTPSATPQDTHVQESDNSPIPEVPHVDQRNTDASPNYLTHNICGAKYSMLQSSRPCKLFLDNASTSRTIERQEDDLSLPTNATLTPSRDEDVLIVESTNDTCKPLRQDEVPSTSATIERVQDDVTSQYDTCTPSRQNVMIGLESSSSSSKHKRKRTWDLQRTFQQDWVAKYPWLDIEASEDGSEPKWAICKICTWSRKKEARLQLKLDTIEKHCGKIYKTVTTEDGQKRVTKEWDKENNRHLKSEIEYNKFMLLENSKGCSKSGSLAKAWGDIDNRIDRAKIAQFSTIVHILKQGRPLSDFPTYESYLNFLDIPHLSSIHWSRNSGMEMARHLNQVIVDDLKESVQQSDFISVSLDEVTAVDTTSWLGMHIYMVRNNERKPYFLHVHKMESASNADNILKILIEALNDYGGMTKSDIVKKLVCFGCDGASVLQGCRNGVSVQLETKFAPYCIGIHCMAHRTNLAYKVVSQFPLVKKIEDLVKGLYSYFCKSPKRYNQFRAIAEVVGTRGKKILKNVETRWISLMQPTKRVWDEYKTLVYLMNKEMDNEVEKAKVLYDKLTNLKMVLGLCGIIPLLEKMNMLAKMSQSKGIYIGEYVKAVKLTNLSFSILYSSNPEAGFKGLEFESWNKLIDLDGNFSFLRCDDEGFVCIHANDELFRLTDESKKQKGLVYVTKKRFLAKVEAVKKSLCKVASTVVSEVRSRFPPNELMEAFSIVFPHFWVNQSPESTRLKMARSLKAIKIHFGREIEMDDVKYTGLLDFSMLNTQSSLFGEVMHQQSNALSDVQREGSMIRLWEELSRSTFLKTNISEYFRLANLCQTFILGSIEDERCFSTLGFLKSKFQNKLDDNLDLSLRLHSCSYEVDTFPYDRALALWKSACKRKGYKTF